jgi:metal-sulfur cluster biosynthetic enzyme
MTKEEITQFEIALLEHLKRVIDPEIEINIVDLGLIYKLEFDGNKQVTIDLMCSTPS